MNNDIIKIFTKVFNVRIMRNNLVSRYYFHVKKIIGRTLMYVDPFNYTYKIMRNLFLSVIIVFIVFLVLLYYNIYLSYFIFIVPLIVILLYEINMRRNVMLRKKGVEKELPLFSMFMATMGELGVRLSEVFHEIAGRNEFSYIAREAKKIIRDSVLFHGSILESVDVNVIDHPSKEWERYMLGITSIIKSGGDLGRYLEDKMKEYLNKYKQHWFLYSKRVGDWSELLLSMFLLTTALSLIAAIIFPNGSLFLIMIMGIVIIPISAIVSILLIDSSLPSGKNFLNGNPIWGIGIGILVFIIMFQFFALWIVLGSAIVISSLIISIPTRRQLREIEEEERWLPSFLLSLIDARKAGISLDQAIAKLRGFGSRIDHILDDLTSQMNMGIPLNQAILKCRSKLFRDVLYTIGELNSRGGGTPMVLEKIRDYVIQVQESQSEAKSSLRFYEILVLLSPIIFSVMIALTYKLSTMNVAFWDSSSDLFQFMQFNDMSIIIESIKVIIIEMCASISLLVSKAKDLTVRSTFLVSITVALALISFLIIPNIKMPLSWLLVIFC